jgi:hypothetical protein
MEDLQRGGAGVGSSSMRRFELFVACYAWRIVDGPLPADG